MTIYTVHAPLEWTGEPDPIRLVFVKEGFCWPGLLVPLPWLLYRRIWIVAILAAGAIAALVLAGKTDLLPFAIAFALLGRFAIGIFGNDLRRRSLEARGFAFRGVVEGGSRDEAEIRYFYDEGFDDLSPPTAPESRARVRSVSSAGVIGLFPVSEGAR